MTQKRLELGQKVFFVEEKQGMTIKAMNEKFAIVTKPYNPQRTVIYSILDFTTQQRNRNNLVFNPYDYAVQEDIDKCMEDLLTGECELSHRGIINLNIDWKRTNEHKNK